MKRGQVLKKNEAIENVVFSVASNPKHNYSMIEDRGELTGKYSKRKTRNSSPKVLQKKLLKDFWSIFKSSRTQKELEKMGVRVVAQNHSKWFKISKLKEYAEKTIFSDKHSNPQKVRHDWDLLKGMAIPRPCFICFSTTTHRHHIIQIQNGGLNDADNIVPICNKCHCIIHPWMK
jgi:hypothetical protein